MDKNVGEGNQEQLKSATDSITAVSLLSDANLEHKHPKPKTKNLFDVDYGEDAATKFVVDNFKKTDRTSENARKENEHVDTTVFVNLAANRGLLNSSLREDVELRKLEKLSKDSAVTIVAQVAMNRDTSLNHLRATQQDRIINNLGGLSPDVTQTEVVRYEIANGSTKLLFSGHSKGLTADLSDLLKSNPNALHADKIMLFNRAHGSAMHGLRGDAGNTSVSELNGTLQNALKNSGHDRFDLVDLDSCLMGNAQVLTELAQTSKYLIASEEPEVAVAQLDMTEQHQENKDEATSNAQPVAEAVKKILMEKGVDLKTTAFNVFTTNEEQCKKVSPEGLCGANTLGLYDETAAPDFSDALNDFGKSLALTSRDNKNMSALQQAIKMTPIIDGEGDGSGHTVKRIDLRSFISTVKSEIGSGQLTDTTDGALTKSAEHLETAMSKMLIANFDRYSPALKEKFDAVHLPAMTLGGVSVFLQAKQLPDMTKSFKKQLADESIPTQPNWNQFVRTMGEPEKDRVAQNPF